MAHDLLGHKQGVFRGGVEAIGLDHLLVLESRAVLADGVFSRSAADDAVHGLHANFRPRLIAIDTPDRVIPSRLATSAPE